MNLLRPIVILAGGKGTRLGDLTKDKPKCLVQVNGFPFISWQLQLLRRAGFKRIIFCLGYGADLVQRYLERHFTDLEIRIIQDVCPGTGLAVKNAARACSMPEFFVTYGDSYLDCNYRELQEAYEFSGKEGLLTVYHNKGRWGKSNVELTDGEITRLSKVGRTGARMEWIDYGVSILRADAFDKFGPYGFDLFPVLQRLQRRGQLAAAEETKRFYEIGTPEGLEELCRHLAKTT